MEVLTPTGTQKVNVIDEVGVTYRFEWQEQIPHSTPVPPVAGRCMIIGGSFKGAAWLYRASTSNTGNVNGGLFFSGSQMANSGSVTQVDYVGCPSDKFVKIKVGGNATAQGVGWYPGSTYTCVTQVGL